MPPNIMAPRKIKKEMIQPKENSIKNSCKNITMAAKSITKTNILDKIRLNKLKLMNGCQRTRSHQTWQAFSIQVLFNQANRLITFTVSSVLLLPGVTARRVWMVALIWIEPSILKGLGTLRAWYSPMVTKIRWKKKFTFQIMEMRRSRWQKLDSRESSSWGQEESLETAEVLLKARDKPRAWQEN
mgnify:CR=1 FL=1